jgi:hypothetical protein
MYRAVHRTVYGYGRTEYGSLTVDGRLLTTPYKVFFECQRYGTGGLTAVKRSIRFIRITIGHTIM